MLKVTKILQAGVPHSLTDFESDDTNSAAYDFYLKYFHRYNDLGKAIGLTRRELIDKGFDLTPAKPHKEIISLPPSKPRKKLQEAPSLFSDEEIRMA